MYVRSFWYYPFCFALTFSACLGYLLASLTVCLCLLFIIDSHPPALCFNPNKPVSCASQYPWPIWDTRGNILYCNAKDSICHITGHWDLPTMQQNKSVLILPSVNLHCLASPPPKRAKKNGWRRVRTFDIHITVGGLQNPGVSWLSRSPGISKYTGEEADQYVHDALPLSYSSLVKSTRSLISWNRLCCSAT